MSYGFGNWESEKTGLQRRRLGGFSDTDTDTDTDSDFKYATKTKYNLGNFKKGLQEDFKTTGVSQQKNIEESPNVRELIEGLFEQLSALLFYGDKEINKLLLRGRYLTRKLNQWIMEARLLKCQARSSLDQGHGYKEWIDLGIKIINQLKRCPFMDELMYDNPINVTEARHTSGLYLPSERYDKKSTHILIDKTKIKQNLLVQVVEMKLQKLTSVHKSMPASIAITQGKLKSTSEITKVDTAHDDKETKISSSSFQQRQIEKKQIPLTNFYLQPAADTVEAGVEPKTTILRSSAEILPEEHIEVKETKISSSSFQQRQIEKTQMPLSNFYLQPAAETVEAGVEPNTTILRSSAEILPEEQIEVHFSSSQPEGSKHHGRSIPSPLGTSNSHFLGNTMIVALSITREMSKFANLKLEKLEILHASSSHQIQHLNNGFRYMDLVRKREHYSFLVKKKFVASDLSGQSIEEHSLSGQVESSKVTDALLPKHMFLNNAGGGLLQFSDDDLRRAFVIDISLQDVSWLPEKPDCPDLVILFLQRNSCLTEIPSTFFSSMPALRFLDLSSTRIKILPNSLFLLTGLQVLMLRNCVCLDKIPTEIGNLHHMEVLDLWGTELINFPVEIGQLSSLKHLQVSFYGPDDESEYTHLPSDLISLGIISRLQGLQALTIVVHPEDHRWTKIAIDIVQDVGSLKMLTFLQFYFPEVKTFQHFIEISPSWNEQKLRRFKFVIGHNVKRIISRVPDEVESKYDQQGKCLRYVNGDEVPKVIKMVLMHASAFYLDHHIKVQNVSEFGISNLKELKFLVVRECPEVQIIGVDTSESVFPSLEYLGVHYLWKLELIWKAPMAPGSFYGLKYLVVNMCPKLEFILTKSMLQCLYNLEEFVVEDCEIVKAIIEQGNETVKYDGPMLPHLEKLVLRLLPELVSLGIDQRLSREKINAYGCPKLNLDSPSIEQTNVKQRKLLGSLFCCSICTRDSID